jgi:hypothetical protein
MFFNRPAFLGQVPISPSRPRYQQLYRFPWQKVRFPWQQEIKRQVPPVTIVLPPVKPPPPSIRPLFFHRPLVPKPPPPLPPIRPGTDRPDVATGVRNCYYCDGKYVMLTEYEASRSGKDCTDVGSRCPEPRASIPRPTIPTTPMPSVPRSEPTTARESYEQALRTFDARRPAPPPYEMTSKDIQTEALRRHQEWMRSAGIQERPPVSTGQCPAGQFWDGSKCRGSVSTMPGIPTGSSGSPGVPSTIAPTGMPTSAVMTGRVRFPVVNLRRI